MQIRRRRKLLVGAMLLLLTGLVVIPSPSTSIAVFLYEVVRQCPDPRPELSDGGEFWVIGHRGASAYAVENTIGSMQRAMELGANGIETDLCMTADSRIVLWHDWNPNDVAAIARQEGGEPDVLCAPVVPDNESPWYRKTHRLTLQELRAHYGYRLKDLTEARITAAIPTLEDFLDWAATQSDLKVVFFDLKLAEEDTLLAPAYITRIRSIIDAYQPSFEVYFLAGEEAVYRNIVPLLPEGNLSFDAGVPSGLVLRPGRFGSVTSALRTGNRIASHVIPFVLTLAPWTTSRRIIEKDMERKMASGNAITSVIAGTTNDPDKWECLIGLGIDGIITDVPDRLRELVDLRIDTYHLLQPSRSSVSRPSPIPPITSNQ